MRPQCAAYCRSGGLSQGDGDDEGTTRTDNRESQDEIPHQAGRAIAARSRVRLRRRRIVLRHLIPNALGPIIVYTTLTIPQVMLLEAVISFLGLGVQAPMSSWGVLIQDGAKVMEDNAWRLIFPSLFLSITLFSLNFLGDGLRDALDPRISKD